MGALIVLCAVRLVVVSAGSNSIRLVGFGTSVTSGRAAPGASTARGAARTSGSFSIAGTVSGLYPGLTLPLVLTITNHQGVAINVQSITTSVSNASKACRAVNMSVSTYTNGTLALAPGASGQVTVQATMLHSAPDSCQGVEFPLQYTGKAS